MKQKIRRISKFICLVCLLVFGVMGAKQEEVLAEIDEVTVEDVTFNSFTVRCEIPKQNVYSWKVLYQKEGGKGTSYQGKDMYKECSEIVQTVENLESNTVYYFVLTYTGANGEEKSKTYKVQTKEAQPGDSLEKNSSDLVETFSGFTFTTDENQTVTITGSGELTYEVMQQSGYYGYNHRSAKKIVIAGDIDTIGEGAFSSYGEEFEVELSKKVKEIKKEAFYSSHVTKVTVAGTINIIGESAFRSCSYLEEMIFDSSIGTIKKDAFSSCFKLYSVSVKGDIKEIGNSAFSINSDLQYMEVEGKVGKIGKYAFNSCRDMERFQVEKGIQGDIGVCAFMFCERLESVNLKKGVTKIAAFAFSECKSIEKIELPSTVEEIGEGAFEYCSSLEKIIIPLNLKNMYEDAFGECSHLTIYYLGSKKDWNKIKIEKNSYDILKNIKIEYKVKTKQSIKLGKSECTFSYSALQKKKLGIELGKYASAKTKLTFKKTSGDAKILVGNDGILMVSPNTKKGTYKIGITVTANATDIYKRATKKIVFTVRVS